MDEKTMPEKVGRYELISRLGVGTFGEVFHARDPFAERDVALKLLFDSVTDPVRRADQLREVRLVCRLDFHPNIVPVLDVNYDECDRMYVVMPLARNGTLRHRLGDPRVSGSQIPPDEAARILWQVASGMELVHQQGIVHRDLKPENILDDGKVFQVADFGLARESVLGTQRVGGTPLYMAPEQMLGVIEARCDVYALGVIFYEMLAGRAPFSGKSIAQILLDARNRSYPALESLNPAVPHEMVELVERAISPKPEERPAHAGALRVELEKWTTPQAMKPVELAATVKKIVNVEPAFAVRLSVEKVQSSSATRDIVVKPTAASKPFHTGDEIRLNVTSDAPGYLTLLNLGASGKVTVLLPNQFTPEVTLPSGKKERVLPIAPGQTIVFPGPNDGFAFELIPPAGKEVIKAFVTRKPVHHSAFTAPSSGGLRVHSAERTRDIAVFAAAGEIAATVPDNWAETSIELDVAG